MTRRSRSIRIAAAGSLAVIAAGLTGCNDSQARINDTGATPTIEHTSPVTIAVGSGDELGAAMFHTPLQIASEVRAEEILFGQFAAVPE